MVMDGTHLPVKVLVYSARTVATVRVVQRMIALPITGASRRNQPAL